VLVLLCFALAIFAEAGSVFAQSPAKQPAAKTGGSVSGRVTIKDKPAGGILVVLRKSEGSNPYDAAIKGVTEQDGTYRILSIPPGSYAVIPTTPAYVPADSAGRKSVVIAEDENVEGINFSLVRGGVITGKVTDSEGHPVIQQQVELYRVEEQKAGAQPRQGPVYPARSAQTDDRGIYRMFGVLAGRYRVSAGRSENSMMQFSISPITYSQVFHPDAKEPAKATVIEVSEASEATNVDIILGPALQMFSASGRIISGDNGAPVPQTRFGLHRVIGDRIEYVNHNAMSDARGEFTMEGLTPGKYGVYLFTNPSTELYVEKTTFDVIDQDVTGLTIKLARGATITGTLILESDDKAAQKKFLEMRLFGYVQTFPGTSNSATSPVGPGGSFRLTGLPPGAAEFQIFPVGAYVPAGFVIARIERDGVAMPRLELKEGEQVNGVKMFVRFGNASIRGVVSFENGTPLPGMRVMIRLSKPGETVQYGRQVEVDARGQFLIDNLPAGMYELRPTVYGGGNARTLDIKKDVSLTEGSTANESISIDVATLGNQ
jgi:protocatechuate 3,4-dioxygenase beta subunit